MALYTVTINDRTNKTKHLLGLIREMAKTDKEYINCEPMPNNETITALNDCENGKLIKSKDKQDFFTKLNA